MEDRVVITIKRANGQVEDVINPAWATGGLSQRVYDMAKTANAANGVELIKATIETVRSNAHELRSAALQTHRDLYNEGAVDGYEPEIDVTAHADYHTWVDTEVLS